MTVQENVGEWFALEGMLANAVETVVRDHLGDKVVISHRESMVGRNRVTTVFQADTDNPMLAWSSGEHLIWQFCRSLAGGTGINLHLLAGAVGGQNFITKPLIACFALSLGEEIE